MLLRGAQRHGRDAPSLDAPSLDAGSPREHRGPDWRAAILQPRRRRAPATGGGSARPSGAPDRLPRSIGRVGPSYGANCPGVGLGDPANSHSWTDRRRGGCAPCPASENPRWVVATLRLAQVRSRPCVPGGQRTAGADQGPGGSETEGRALRHTPEKMAAW